MTVTPSRKGRFLGPMALTGVLALGAFGLFPWSASQAQVVRAAPHPGYGRIVFDWTEPVNFSASVAGGALVIQFDKPFEGSVASVASVLPGYVGEGSVSSDRRSVTFPLKGTFTPKSFRNGAAVVVDLQGRAADVPVRSTMATGAPSLVGPAREGSRQAAAVNAASPARSAAIPVRTGVHDGFFRVVFDWPRQTPYSVETKENAAVIRFGRPGRIDAQRLKARLPEGQKDMDVSSGGDGLTVTLPLAPGGSVRHFRSGHSIAIDLRTAGGTPVAAASPPTSTAAPSTSTAAPSTSTAEPSTSTAAPPRPEPSAPVTGSAAEPASSRADEKEQPATVPAVIPPAGSTVASAADAVTEGAAASLPATSDPETAKTSEPDAVTASGSDVAPHTAADAAPAALPDLDDGFRYAFRWSEPVAAAAFRRAGYVWVVFDKAAPVDIEALRRAGGDHLKFIDTVDMQGRGTAVRMIVDPAINPSFRREGLTWILEMTEQPLAPVTALTVTPQPVTNRGPRIYIPVDEGGTVLSVLDPEVGDLIYVVPIMPLGNGIYPAARFPDVTLPATAQGLLVEPMRENLKVRSSRQGIEITADGGLTLSEPPPKPAEAVPESLAAGMTLSTRVIDRTFDFPGWHGERSEPFPVRRDRAATAAFREFPAKPEDRNASRLDYARFLVANGYAAEALGLLDLIAESGPTAAQDPDVRSLRGVALYLMERDDEAIEALSDPAFQANDEVAFWHNAAVFRRDGAAAPEAVKQALASSREVIEPYPAALRVPLALAAAEAALAVDDDRATHQYLELAALPTNTTDQVARLTYLDGRYHELLGDFDTALARYERTEEMRSARWAMRALRDRLNLEHELDFADVDQVIAGLEHIRFSWRGDDFEFEVLQQLQDLHLQNGDPGSALRTLKIAAEYFPDRPDSAAVTDEMKRIFEELYLNGAADNLSPITAIALYDEFRELTPTDARGDAMITRLSDSLVKVDLLEQAAYLLDHQLATRLLEPGEERSRIGARLALLRLLNNQPEHALRALEDTDFKPLPEALQTQRVHLEARGLADLGYSDRAIARLEGDTSREAQILRTEIYWKDQNWSEAAKTISRLVPVPARGETLSDEDAVRVLDWATALLLSEDETQVALLRRRYMESLRGTFAFDAFNLITSPKDYGYADVARVTDKVAQVDNFRSFLSAYRAKVREDGLSTVN